MINLKFATSILVLTALSLVAGAAPMAVERSPAVTGVGRDAPRNAIAQSKAFERQYLQADAIAMAKMMRDMVPNPSGDADRDFVAQMIPHHQGAIDMAVAILRAGRNQQLKRLAQEIIVTQQEEITAMCVAIGEPAPNAVAAPDKQQMDVSPAHQLIPGHAKIPACTHD